MSNATKLALGAWLSTFLFFIAFTGNTAQSEFFFCIVAASVAAGFTYLQSPSAWK